MKAWRAWSRLEPGRLAAIAALALTLALTLALAGPRAPLPPSSPAGTLAQAALSGASIAWAQSGADSSLAPIPEPVGFVNDQAGILSETTRAQLDGFLDQLKRKTTAEFAVLTVRTTAPETPSEYKVRVFQSWGIGQRDQDNGLLLLIAIEEREARFETGYGLEGTLPDGLQSRIVRQRMIPHFRQGDWDQGVIAGVTEIAGRIAAERNVTLEWDGRPLRYRSGRSMNLGVLAPIVLLILILIAIAIARGGGGDGGRPRHRRRLLFPGTWDGGLGGWGGGFGGGWGGGGGGFGGGGGGGSFGGFGGGGSGGGGGGGSW